MKTQRRHLGALEFINDILLARARLAQAKSDLALAKARAQRAGLMEKESKQSDRFGLKQVRRADTEFIRAKDTLAKMEKKYFTAVQQTAGKPAPARLIDRAAAGAATGRQQARINR